MFLWDCFEIPQRYSLLRFYLMSNMFLVLVCLQRIHVARAPHGLFAAETLLEIRHQTDRNLLFLALHGRLHVKLRLYPFQTRFHVWKNNTVWLTARLNWWLWWNKTDRQLILGHYANYAVCPTKLVDLDAEQNVFTTSRSWSEFSRIRIGSPDACVSVVAQDWPFTCLVKYHLCCWDVWHN